MYEQVPFGLHEYKLVYEYKPNFKVVGSIYPTYTIEELNKEIPMAGANPGFVKQRGGRISNFILEGIPEDYFQLMEDINVYPSIDIRLHELLPGEIPSITQWHCDTPSIINITCTVSSHPEGVSNTEFLNQEFSMPDDPGIRWRILDEAVLSLPEINIYHSKDGDLTLFDNNTIHRAAKTKNEGVRLFFRMSMTHKCHTQGGMIYNINKKY